MNFSCELEIQVLFFSHVEACIDGVRLFRYIWVSNVAMHAVCSFL